MELYELYITYKQSRRGKRRSADQVSFELNQFSRLGALYDSMCSRTYIPSSNYSFIHRRPKPREVWACNMEHKILQTYLCDRFKPILEKMLTDRTFNNRVGYGTHAAINQVIEDIYTASCGYTKDCWIIKLDLRGYFPNINQDISWGIIEKAIIDNYFGDVKDELLYIAKVINYDNPQYSSSRQSSYEEWQDIAPYKSLYNKPYGTGGAIGYLYWQLMSNGYLSDIDKWIINNISPYYTRFVDDMVIITDNKEGVLLMIPILRKMLQDIGIELHPKKFYCQHYTKGLEYLGYHIKPPHRIHLNRKIITRAFNAAKKSHRRNYIATMNSYLGMIKTSTDTEIVVRLIDSVPKRFNKDYKHYKIS